MTSITSPAFPQGPPPWPPLDTAIQAALEEAWRSGNWGKYQGPYLALLEEQLATLCGVSHAYTCASGTFAVELALRALAIAPGDEVVLAAYDFSGNFRAVEAVGARPVLVDLAPGSWRMDENELAAAVSSQVKAIVVSHLHGSLANMEAICGLAAQWGIAVVEDAAQTPGALVAGKPAGSWGDCGVLSFGGSKLLTAGRGGAVVTNRPEALQRMKIFCERGNHAFPLSELQAAVLLPQLAQLAPRNALRLRSAQHLCSALAPCEMLLGDSPPRALDVPAFYKLPFRLPVATTGDSLRERFIDAAQAEGIALDAGFRGFVKRPASCCRKQGDLKHSADAIHNTVLLHHPILLESSTTLDLLATTLRHLAETLPRSSPSAPRQT